MEMEKELKLSRARCLKRGIKQDLTSPLLVLGKKELQRRIKENYLTMSVFAKAVKKIMDYLEGMIFF